MSFARVYPCYIAKAEKKGRTKEEVDAIIRWLKGYSQKELATHLRKQMNRRVASRQLHDQILRGP